MKPLISIIVPTHNNAPTIAAALESLCTQTYPHIEIIVVDDKSTDGTQTVVDKCVAKDSRIHRVEIESDDPYRLNRIGVNINAGYSARNHGVEKANGEVITFQDADDLSYANRIEIQYELLQKYGAMHAVVDYEHPQEGVEEMVGRELPVDLNTVGVLGFDEINKLAKENKPIPRWLRDPLSYRSINIHPIRLIKRLGRKLFWCDIKPYPCSGNTAMVRREVFDAVCFRPLWERTRPSRKGRGADMDFNYAVAERFGKSIAIKAPLYLWRT